MASNHEAKPSADATEGQEEAGGWRDISTAPRAQVIDLWAKRWNCMSDTFEYRRFPACKGVVNVITGPNGYYENKWAGLDEGWYASHWRPLPSPPHPSPQRSDR